MRLFEPRYRFMLRRAVESTSGLFVLVDAELDAGNKPGDPAKPDQEGRGPAGEPADAAALLTSSSPSGSGTLGLVCRVRRYGFISPDLQSMVEAEAVLRVVLQREEASAILAEPEEEEALNGFGLRSLNGVAFADVGSPLRPKLFEEDLVREGLGEQLWSGVRKKQLPEKHLTRLLTRLSYSVEFGHRRGVSALSKDLLWRSRCPDRRLRAVLAGDLEGLLAGPNASLEMEAEEALPG